MDAPIWPGEPIAFMTQTEDRVQSANATSYHAALAATAGAERFTQQITEGIVATLEDVAKCESLPHAILAGALGNAEDGAYPGTFGRGSVTVDGH